MVAIARDQGSLAVGGERYCGRPRFRIAKIDFAGRGQCFAGDRKYRDGSFPVIGDQSQRARGIDCDATRTKPCLERGDYGRRVGF